MGVLVVKGQTVEVTNRIGCFLVSYGTPVAFRDVKYGETWVSENRFSRTTKRHIELWLDGGRFFEVPHSEIVDLYISAGFDPVESED